MNITEKIENFNNRRPNDVDEPMVNSQINEYKRQFKSLAAKKTQENRSI